MPPTRLFKLSLAVLTSCAAFGCARSRPPADAAKAKVEEALVAYNAAVHRDLGVPSVIVGKPTLEQQARTMVSRVAAKAGLRHALTVAQSVKTADLAHIDPHLPGIFPSFVEGVSLQLRSLDAPQGRRSGDLANRGIQKVNRFFVDCYADRISFKGLPPSP